MASAYADKQIEGLEVLAVLGEDGSGGEPSEEYCKSYAESAGFDPAKMVIDYGGSSGGWETLFQRMANGGNGGIGLPWDAVLDGRGMIYVYNTEQGEVAPSTAVQELLDKD